MWGSPPRVREKLSFSDPVGPPTGITPACAGKTGLYVLTQKTKRDHPRVCGKNAIVGLKMVRLAGSPPRVREKLCRWWFDKRKSGITPACAGKTSRFGNQGVLYEDHPRVCGKNRVVHTKRKYGSGSPPRVREKPNTFEGYPNGRGITPACAGKTYR